MYATLYPLTLSLQSCPQQREGIASQLTTCAGDRATSEKNKNTRRISVILSARQCQVLYGLQREKEEKYLQKNI